MMRLPIYQAAVPSFELGAPHDQHPDFRVLSSAVGEHLLVVDGSRLYDLDQATAAALRELLDDAPTQAQLAGLRASFSAQGPRIDGAPLEPPPLRSLSLNVAQGCNLACTYCYADEGAFGGQARMMSEATAFAAVDRLFAEAEPEVDLVVGFMGGEPMLAKQLVHATTRYAADKASAQGRRVKFSLTTNATRIDTEDARLFAEHGFAVSVSLDGPPELNDRTRPDHRGRGSYAAALAGIEAMSGAQRPGHLSARITVTPESGRLLPILEHVLGLGFDDAGFAPVIASPTGAGEFSPAQMQGFLAAMIECGEAAKAALLTRARFPFTNFETALNEIHRGSHRPYPCGAGAAYLSVSAEGELFACHRLVDDPSFAMGSVAEGSDLLARRAHLARRHVDRISPCRGCWARYLCGGGCYHEVDRRGRVGCDYIRGWLEFCLAAYAELSTRCPDYFLAPQRYLSMTETRA